MAVTGQLTLDEFLRLPEEKPAMEYERGVIAQKMAPNTLVNVNFPAIEPSEVKGVRVCRQGIRDYGRLRIIERTDPRGFPYFWFGLAPAVETPGHRTDLEAIADGFVTVTPLHLDMTFEPAITGLEDLFG